VHGTEGSPRLETKTPKVHKDSQGAWHQRLQVHGTEGSPRLEKHSGKIPATPGKTLAKNVAQGARVHGTKGGRLAIDRSTITL